MRHLHLLLTSTFPLGPALQRLRARGRDLSPAATGPTAALERLFHAENTLAPILLAAEGLSHEDAGWYRADPVHLLAGMHSINLFDSRRFSLSADEARSLVDILNAHFSGEARFVAPHPTRWYVRFEHPLEAHVPALDEMLGVPVEPHLVRGPDATRLHRFAMEAQMLLHDASVNDAREARGELPINGLWFWGGGTWRQPEAGFDRVLADDFAARALAGAAGIEVRPLPDVYEPMAGRILAVLETPADTGRLDSDWFGPILAALKWGRLDTLDLEAPGPGGFHVGLGRRQAWRFWRVSG